jgi:phosphoribosyl-ATP pyrophosphohydrolase
MGSVAERVFDTVVARRDNAPEGSYTARLYAAGETEILKKIGEEAVEVVVAASKQTDDRIIYELADLVYHSMVLLASRGLTWSQVEEELASRMK